MESATSWLVFVFRTVVLLVIPAAFFLVKGKDRLRLSNLVEKIPGPSALPLIGNALLMAGNSDLAGNFAFFLLQQNMHTHNFQNFSTLFAKNPLKTTEGSLDFGLSINLKS